MPLPPFKPSVPLTIGVELELQLVDPATLDLSPRSAELIGLLKPRALPAQVVHEITQSMVELVSGVHTGHAGLLAELRLMRDHLVDAAAQVGVHVCGGGTHPFQRWSERRITARPRYQRVSQLYGYLAKQFTVFGQHIHVGVASGDDALYLLHALAPYVPQFVALSASSPCVQGADTVFDSARSNTVAAFPMSGYAPFELSWDAFQSGYFSRIEATGIAQGMKDFYWDIRPKPEYGTVELRVCDTPLDVDRAAALAGYLQVLSAWLLAHRQGRPDPDDQLVYKYNRFQAARFGLEAELVRPGSGEPLPLRDHIGQTLDRLAPLAVGLGAGPALQAVAGLLAQGNDASALRALAPVDAALAWPAAGAKAAGMAPASAAAAPPAVPTVPWPQAIVHESVRRFAGAGPGA